MNRILIILCLTAICGCAGVPFKPVERVSMEGLQPGMVLERFAGQLPQRFTVLNSTVFAYRTLKFSCIGPLQADTAGQAFTVVGMNHVGVKLFELRLSAGAVEARYVFPELTKHGDFARAVCDDIQKIYFDRVPAADASVVRERDKIIFRRSSNGGSLEHVFAGRDNLLVEKHYSVNGRRLWSVFYYEYRRQQGKVFPGGIVLRNYRYGYYLAVRLKEIAESE